MKFIFESYEVVGYNYRMTDLQAAVGSAQLDRADWILSERIRCADTYGALLGDLDWLVLPSAPAGYRHAYQAYVCRFEPEPPTLDTVDRLHEQRNRLMAALEAEGISTRPGTHAAFAQGYYRSKYGLQPADYPNAYLADRLTLALPLFPGMTDADLEYVAHHLRQAGTGDGG